MTPQPKLSSAARVLLDASNLAVGGGVQVAASLVDEFRKLQEDPATIETHPWLPLVTYHLSPEVAENLTTSHPEGAIHVVRRRWSQPEIWVARREDKFDLQLTVFGPRYGRRLAPITITGIADVTSIYPWPEGVPAGPFEVRLKRAVRGIVARRLFARESFLISESNSLLEAFTERCRFHPSGTQVIPNVVNAAVADPAARVPLGVDLRASVEAGTALLCYVARLYPHKNHALLPKVRSELLKLGLNAKFVVTLTTDEWAVAPDELKEACINVGVIPVAQVADLNLQCHAAIFPSLLESFSATPLEALTTNGLLFAADRPFVRDVCGDAASYFDPLDPENCAHVVFDALSHDDRCRLLRQRAAEVSAHLGTARERALAHVDLVSELLADRRSS